MVIDDNARSLRNEIFHFLATLKSLLTNAKRLSFRSDFELHIITVGFYDRNMDTVRFNDLRVSI